ncbi:MAG: SRPBCC family protein [Pyrinomonadaceae bacterium]|nr:SRPBCC family protein [Pyrinomonadaceae bacterium]
MKYTVDVVINKPVDEVLKDFDDPDNLTEWLEGLESFEHLEGIKGEVGAKAKFVFDMGKRRVEMIETITAKELPHKFDGTYEADGVFNRVWNRFETDGNDQTRWTQTCEFEFTNLMMKIMGFFMPFAFKKQTRTQMEAFKKFSEGQG